MLNTKETTRKLPTSHLHMGTWIHEVLEPEQLSTAPQPFGRQKMSRATLTILWILRVYVVLMLFVIAWQITGPQVLHLHP